MQKGTSCGIIPARKKENGEWEFLLLQAHGNGGSWTFPKGFQEDNETPLETAVRETEEEAGLPAHAYTVFEQYTFHEDYNTHRFGVPIRKSNVYFLALVKANPEITIQDSEIKQYRWVSYEEARQIFSYPTRQKMFEEAYSTLTNL